MTPALVFFLVVLLFAGAMIGAGIMDWAWQDSHPKDDA